MNSPVTCTGCGRPIADWKPYRLQDRLFICFRCPDCDRGHQVEARFELAKGGLERR